MKVRIVISKFKFVQTFFPISSSKLYHLSVNFLERQPITDRIEVIRRDFKKRSRRKEEKCGRFRLFFVYLRKSRILLGLFPVVPFLPDIDIGRHKSLVVRETIAVMENERPHYLYHCTLDKLTSYFCCIQTSR